MQGVDTSHHQGDKGLINWNKVKAAGYEFAILKCTQGTTFVDGMFKRDKAEARKAGLLVGYYHFAGNLRKVAQSAVQEAQFFVKTVGDIRPGEFLVLDWEINHANPVAWCKTFLDEVTKLAGFKPLFYTNAARLSAFDWTPVISADYGLWVAKYASAKVYVPYWLQTAPTSGKWPFWAIWQYSSKGSVNGIVGNVDLNYTKMDISVLKKYGKQTVECTHCCPKHCV